MVGTTIPVTLTMDDTYGNLATCVGNVTVVDDLAPLAICKDLSVTLDNAGKASIIPSEVDGGSSDNCSITSYELSRSTFDCEDVGLEKAVTLTLKDASNNTSSCTAIVTIEDVTTPAISCQDITLKLDESGEAEFSTDMIVAQVTDACAKLSLNISSESFDCSNVGQTFERIASVQDQSGNTNSCSAQVSIVDELAPVALCLPFQALVTLDGNGFAKVRPERFDQGSYDACSAVELSLNKSSFDCNDLGLQQLSLKVTDASGNTTSCTSSILIIDKDAPVLNCWSDNTVGGVNEVRVFLDEDGNGSITPDQIVLDMEEACEVTYDISQTDFTCEDVGFTEVTLTAKDVAGNVSNPCYARVFVDAVFVGDEPQWPQSLELGDDGNGDH